MNFRQLNSYSEAWRSNFLGTIATMKKVPASWIVYSTIDLSNGYFHIYVDEQLQSLFCFELNGKRFAYQIFPKGWASNASLFHSKISISLSNLLCVTYVDDIIVGGRDRKEHDVNLGLV